MFHWQFPDKMIDFKAIYSIEFVTAVAVAAYAITLLKEEKYFNQNKAMEQLTHPTTNTKSKREDNINKVIEGETRSGSSLFYILSS